MDKQNMKLHIVHGLTIQDLTDDDLRQLANQSDVSEFELELIEEELCSRRK